MNEKKNKNFIELKDGNLHFGKFKALKDISFNIKRGERVAIIGHNGAGKSTLLDVMIGIKKLSSGKVLYGDKNFKSELGVQFQNKDFPQGLKFKSLLNFYLDVYKIKRNDPKVINLLKSFQVDKILNRNLQNLSGGQKQKISILIALINSPKIVVFDEILTALDITSQSQIINLLVDYLKNDPTLTVISVSHNETEIAKLVDRLLVLKDGELIEDITTKKVLKEHGSIVGYMNKLGGDHA